MKKSSSFIEELHTSFTFFHKFRCDHKHRNANINRWPRHTSPRRKYARARLAIYRTDWSARPFAARAAVSTSAYVARAPAPPHGVPAPPPGPRPNPKPSVRVLPPARADIDACRLAATRAGCDAARSVEVEAAGLGRNPSRGMCSSPQCV